MIDYLISKTDVSEVALKALAQLLADESQNQSEIAEDQGIDPSPWIFDVFIDKTNPLDLALDTSQEGVPVVNVWFESSQARQGSGNSIDSMTYDAIYNVDCYVSSAAMMTKSGKVGADEIAADKARKLAAVVRNIINSDIYHTLGVERRLGMIGGRAITSVTAFSSTGTAVAGIAASAIRIVVEVKIHETTKSTDGQRLDEICSSFSDFGGKVISTKLISF